MPAADRRKRTLRPAPPPTEIALLTKPSSSTSKPTSSQRQGSWTPSRILTPSSALTSPETDIHAFLITCISGFSSYTEPEKRAIITSLPPSYRLYNLDFQGQLLCPITTDFVMSDAYLKRGVAKFKKDMGEGFYEEQWQRRGRGAMEERARGEFDGYLKQWVEDTFGEGEDGDEDRESASQAGEEGGGRVVVDEVEAGARAGKPAVAGRDCGGDNDDEDKEVDYAATSSDGKWARNTTKNIARRIGRMVHDETGKD